MSGANDQQKRPTGRKLAEWVTLGLSVLLVLAIAGLLVYGGMKEHPPAVPVEVRVLAAQAQEVSGRYVVPVEVRNLGRRTLKDLTVRVDSTAPDGTNAPAGDVTIDYLAARAVQKIYLYFERHPRDLRIDVRPFSYRLE